MGNICPQSLTFLMSSFTLILYRYYNRTIFFCWDLHLFSIDDFALYCMAVLTFMDWCPVIIASTKCVFLLFSIIRVTVGSFRPIFNFIGIWLRFVALMTGWPSICTVPTLCLFFLSIMVIASCFKSFQFAFYRFLFMPWYFYVRYVMKL